MASIGSYLPPPGSAVWRRDVPTHPHIDPHAQEGKRVRHVVIRDAQIWSKPAPYVVYRVDVLTEHDHWCMYKRYSQFYALHSKLVKKYGTKVQLPPKKLSGNLSKTLIDKRRQSLETYLQKLVHGESQVALSPELMEFLDVPTHDVIEVTDVLTRHLYLHGDQLLEEETPISLSVNEMYAITKRLLFPRDTRGKVFTYSIKPGSQYYAGAYVASVASGNTRLEPVSNPAFPDASLQLTDVASDPAHLYSFVQGLESLKVSLPPSPTSVCCSNFDISHFKSLHTFKMDKVPLSQVTGLVSVQQQLSHLSVHRGLHTLRELLIEAVEEKRGSIYGGSNSPTTRRSSSSITSESWRISATARLTTSRVIVQPWHSLHTLNLSHNLLTHLDDSLQLLPSLRELNLSHNQLQELHLHYLCLPGLEKLSLSHNSITVIHTDKKVLERITYLNLSHNRLSMLNWLHAFVGLSVLNVAYNILSQRLDLDKLTQLRQLNTLTMAGNPITSSNTCRMFVLAKFIQKARKVVLDGQEATSKELARFQGLVKKYGPEPDVWPIAKSLTYVESSAETQTPPTTPTQAVPDVEVSWQVQSSFEQKPRPLIKYRSSSLPLVGPRIMERPAAPSHGSFDRLPSPQHEQSQEKHLLSQSIASRKLNFTDLQSHQEQYTVGGSVSGVSKGSVKSLSFRAEPDGQSDISSASPEPTLNGGGQSERSSLSVLTSPTSTPLFSQETSSSNNITPAMIRSALESLQFMQSSTPKCDISPLESSNSSQICPETVANALSVFIRQESLSVSSDTPNFCLSPPPSTPLSESSVTPSNTLSASDLVSALSALAVPSRQSSIGPSGESSVATSAPACTPSDEREWLKLGFKPEDVIQALTALSLLQMTEEADSSTNEDVNLSPIQEETVTAKQPLDYSEGRHINDDVTEAPPDFVFSPPELEDNVAHVSAFIESCSPADDVLYS